MGLFERFKKGLQKTASLLNTDIRDLFRQEGRLVDEEFLRESVRNPREDGYGYRSRQRHPRTCAERISWPRREDE